MQILTWNLWWRFGPWEERQPAIAATLKRVKPDIALLQEVFAEPDGEDQAELLGAESGWNVARSQRPDGTPYRFGNAILSRWPILWSATVVLPGADGLPSHRSAVLAEVETPGGPQVVASTHLAWQYGETSTRQQQLEVVTRAMAERRATNELVPMAAGDPMPMPMILGGDFNAVPDADEVRRLTGRAVGYGIPDVFVDSWEVVGEGPGHTWTRTNPHTPDAQWPRRRLDYVMVSWPRPGRYGNAIAAQLVGVEPTDGVVPSDHYAVVVDLDDRMPEESP